MQTHTHTHTHPKTNPRLKFLYQTIIIIEFMFQCTHNSSINEINLISFFHNTIFRLIVKRFIFFYLHIKAHFHLTKNIKKICATNQLMGLHNFVDRLSFFFFLFFFFSFFCFLGNLLYINTSYKDFRL